jgi:hypothetical protein
MGAKIKFVWKNNHKRLDHTHEAHIHSLYKKLAKFTNEKCTTMV